MVVESVAEFCRRHALELVRFAYLISGDRHRAEDLVQDVLLAMHRRFGDDLPLDKPVAYARRSIVNANVSWVRRPLNSELALDTLPDREARHSASDPADRDLLWHALRRLPERQRSVLVMRYYLDASDDDIGEALGCRRGSVRSLASRGLAALRSDPSLALEGDLS